MRLSRLDLKRYGKFTDRSISMPRATRDFHLIVGPNEAGKSTLRDAVKDLLFGIETRSRYNFLHPHSEMCLGALVEHGDERLEFIRTKARTKTLQTANGAALPDSALMPFLGQVDRTFFDQMFGLDHERLVRGGQEILSASNDVGQILFQAAAGIGGLGQVRDRLEAEADKLWAKRKSSDREYYIASAELDQAEAELRQTTVRTRDWQEAKAQVDRLKEELRQARDRFEAVEQERIQLERVRRVSPMLVRIAELERQLADLGEVVALPDTTARQLEGAERQIAIGTQSLTPLEKQSAELQDRIDKLHPDESFLARAADIDSLSEVRQQLRNHEGDIGKREEEIRLLWQDVQGAMRQLGWPEQDEEAVAQRLPSSLVQSALDSLIHRHEALEQALSAAEESCENKEQEVKGINAEVAALPSSEIPVTLIEALATARALGDVVAQEKKGATQVGRLKRDLDAASRELGKWGADPDALRKVLLPPPDETNRIVRKRGELEGVASTISARLAETAAEGKMLQLQISQYKAAHQPVTLGEVQQSRTSRDTTWQAIKTGAATLKEAAPSFEREVAEADELSDRRHDRAQEETELQALLDRSERVQQQVADLQARLDENTRELTILDDAWEARVKPLGLSGMPPAEANGWRIARERVLSVADSLAEAQATQAELEEGISNARAALTNALVAVRSEASGLNLAALILLADEVVGLATRNRERGSTLSSQKLRAEAAIPELRNRVAQAQKAMTKWHADLKESLSLAHLPESVDVGTIKSSLVLLEAMRQQLQKIREIRDNRIAMMRRDLRAFEENARSMAAALAPELEQESPSQIALALASRLKSESAAFEELARLKTEHGKAVQQAGAASAKIDEARAGLDPLFRLAGTTTSDGLRAAIEMSDRARKLTDEVNQSMKELTQAGEGLGREALDAEFSALGRVTIPARLVELKGQVDEIVAHQNRLSADLNSAERTLGAIAGQDDAARAESHRQQALARMSNAVERYIKVFTAAKLLRWSIERFRESKQGPMLASASEVFSGLTQGGFTRLVVDYESEPLKLSGLRSTGELVDIDGMSEGTRDQLYFALRLAAVELHLGQTIPLPFIADDLFINYDDGRARAGLAALAKLSEMTQVIFLTHHAHLVPLAQSVFGEGLNVLSLN